MRVLLVSTYELGHQPWHVASPAAALAAAGHQVRMRDLAVETLGSDDLRWSDGVAFSVPMHTAMRLAAATARQVKGVHPDLPVCFYGLYAELGPEVDGRIVDRAIAGEYEQDLCEWADAVDRRVASTPRSLVTTGKTHFRVPERSGLPDLTEYTHLRIRGEHRAVGYVETSHGCRHGCRHCPVPVIYGGKWRVVDDDAVLEDIARLVKLGARHITFGDPDFLNGPIRARNLLRTVHEGFPDLTFDITTKVELILRHDALWPELSETGLLFVVSAFETTNDEILTILDKGHTRAEAGAAVRILREAGVEVRPTWLPFTPWSTVNDLRDIVDFLAEYDLFGNVDPVQLTIRLLLPRGSLLLDRPELTPYLDYYDEEKLGWQWHAADSQMDDLHARLAQVLEQAVADGLSVQDQFARLVGEILEAPKLSIRIPEGGPRLTEPWFC
jgi:radical SAM superfamily enzyme YgiQ (UPF0313 family)